MFENLNILPKLNKSIALNIKKMQFFTTLLFLQLNFLTVCFLAYFLNFRN